MIYIKYLYLSIQKKKNGTGVGLFLVKKIINYHNGQVLIKSDNDCTKVYIKLPL